MGRHWSVKNQSWPCYQGEGRTLYHLRICPSRFRILYSQEASQTISWTMCWAYIQNEVQGSTNKVYFNINKKNTRFKVPQTKAKVHSNHNMSLGLQTSSTGNCLHGLVPGFVYRRKYRTVLMAKILKPCHPGEKLSSVTSWLYIWGKLLNLFQLPYW